MNNNPIRFTRAVGILAVIEGNVKKEADRLEFELAMTESVTGPGKNVIQRQIHLSELQSVSLKRRIFRKSCLEFTARSLRTFHAFPGSTGLAFSVMVENSHRDAASFVRDVLFEMTEIETEKLRKRIPSTEPVETKVEASDSITPRS